MPETAWHYLLYPSVLVFVTAISFVLAAYAWRRRSTRGAAAFAVFAALAGITAGANAVEITAADLAQKVLFANIQYFGYAMLPVMMLFVALPFTGREHWPDKRRVLAVYLLPAITLALVWTTDLHGLIRYDVHLVAGTPFSYVGKTYGAWFWVHAAYSYLLLLSALYLLAERVRQGNGLHREQPLTLLAAFVLPLAANLVYLLRLGPLPQIDVTPAVFALSALIIARGIFHNHLFDIVPIAHGQVIAGMTDGLIVLDARGNVVDCNDAAAALLGKPRPGLLGRTDEAALGEWPELLALGRAGRAVTVELVFGPGPEQRYAEVRSAHLRDRKGNHVGVVLALRDISERVIVEEALRESEERFRRLAENAEDIIFRYDLKPSRGFAYVSPAVQRIIGYLPEEFYDRSDLAFSVTRVEDHAALAQLLAGQTLNVPVEIQAAHRDGKDVWLEVKAAPIHDVEGELASIEAIVRDITERKRGEEEVRQANERLMKWVGELAERNREGRLLNEMADLLLSCLTLAEAYKVVGQVAPKLFPDDGGQLAILDAAKAQLTIVAGWGDAPAAGSAMASDHCWALRRAKPHQVDRLHVGPVCDHVGERLEGDRFCVPMLAQGEMIGVLHIRLGPGPERGGLEGRVKALDDARRLAVTMAETTTLALVNLRLRHALREQAIRDPLTGLFNRRYMEETLNRELARVERRHGQLGLLMLDIDHFKSVNDSVGHEAGDTVLRGLGQYLCDHLRTEDVACRIGGDEFVLILPDAALPDVITRAEQLRQGIASIGIEARGRGVGSLTVSIGVAAFPEHGQRVEHLLRAVDVALYQAKADGRDRVVAAEYGARAWPALRFIQEHNRDASAEPVPPATA